MKRSRIRIVTAFALLLLFVGAAHVADAERAQAPEIGDHSDATTGCMDMMQSPGVSEEGKKQMREFMQSDRAPQAMANLMEMARSMGNGNPMLGMTRMMEMMDGQGGMMQPGHPSGK